MIAAVSADSNCTSCPGAGAPGENVKEAAASAATAGMGRIIERGCLARRPLPSGATLNHHPYRSRSMLLATSTREETRSFAKRLRIWVSTVLRLR